jgi:predicted Zn-dependent protease
MSNEKLDLIEKGLNSKNIEEYEIYLVEKNIYETIFLKNQADNEREIRDFEYFIRILSQKKDETGIGVIKGNSLDKGQIDKNIDICATLSKFNSSTKYFFPGKTQISDLNTADKKILDDPIAIKNDLAEALISEASQQKDVKTTFGRFRIHSYHNFLRNNNALNLDSKKTFFFVEFALKAQENGKLSEFWDVEYYKEKEHLKFNERVNNWARRAKDTLRAEEPKPANNAIVIFTPPVLKAAISPVIGFHALALAHFEKLSRYNIGDKVASDNITLIDDGLLDGGLSSNSWDAQKS